jgi:hypothetical protein
MLATQEADIRRIRVQSQPRQIVQETLSQKNLSHKKQKQREQKKKKPLTKKVWWSDSRFRP